MRKLRRHTGVPFPIWLGELTDENKKMAPFLIWREFWNDGFTPEEALIKVRGK
mgnify:FL=1|tara:strand:+ start:10 stop:168 length:159 start_codon:yes stop_codon:yes gene_type:complete